MGAPRAQNNLKVGETSRAGVENKPKKRWVALVIFTLFGGACFGAGFGVASLAMPSAGK